VTSDVDQIRALATQYFDGLYEGDVSKLGDIFHEKSHLHVLANGTLAEMDLPSYMKVVAGRASPKSQNAKRQDEIVSISVTSPHAAVLAVKVVLIDKAYTDQLALIKDGGKWRIMSKIYFLNNPK
jgi:hypothetical protein